MNMMFPKPTKQKKRKKHKKSIMQPKGDRRCYLCMLLDGDFTYKPYLEEHHVLFGNTHAFAEAEGLKVNLCLEHARIEAEKNARIKADDEIKANRAKTLDAVKTTTKEGIFVDALAVKELSEKMDDIDVKTENLGKKIAIFVDSVVKGSVSFNTSD